MSLRLRLVLTLLSVVAMIGVADLVSLRINRGVESRIKALRTRSRGRAEAADFEGRAVEVEGRFDEAAGVFVAESVEWLPGPRAPKLRGAIQSVDAAGGTITLYGQSLAVTSRTEFENGEGADRLAALSPGTRVEVVVKVGPAGAWSARKIETHGIKASDKVKGTVTGVEAAGKRSWRIDLQGLPVLVERTTALPNPRSPLNRMEGATRMILAVQDGRTAAQELLKEAYRLRSLRQDHRAEAARIGALEERIEDVEKTLRRAPADFASYLAQSRAAAEKIVRPGSGPPRDPGAIVAERQKVALWLNPLSRLLPRWREADERFARLATENPDAAQVLLRDHLEPLLRDEVLPLVHAYQLETERELSGQLGAAADEAEAAARLAITTKIAGIVVALVLGLLVSRTISRPIRSLEVAARRLGRGSLDTRVDVRSQDELGVLAGAFNHMAEELAATTVSVSNLNTIIDSMAGALLLLDPEGRITSVNPAALTLLGYDREALAGKPFASLCPEEEGEGSLLRARPAETGVQPTVERTFQRRDGTALPVSCSVAAMRDDAGKILGSVLVAQDLTERKRVEERIRQSLAEKDLMLREVHHRVKNNLQVISSILDLQSRTIADAAALERFQQSQDRIRSMSLLHEQLYRAGDLRTIDFPNYLQLLASHLAQSHEEGPGSPHVTVRAEAMGLDLDQALACGLIVNELVTNAYKHAFREGEGGTIRIESRRREDGRCELDVADDGRGLPRAFDPAKVESLGMSLVSTLVDQIQGTLAIERDGGATFRITFPPREAPREESRQDSRENTRDPSPQREAGDPA